jgi:hypothetical protein
MNMDMPQRLNTFPPDSYDVPLDQLIVRGGLLDGPALSYADEAQKATTKKAGLLDAGGDGAKIGGMKEKDFLKNYYQHIDLRGRDGSALSNKDAILRDGFKSDRVNALPVSSGGKPLTAMDRNYAAKVGDTVYLVPKSAIEQTKNGPRIKPGWKPQPNEVVTVDDPSRPMFDYFNKGN